MNLKLIEKEDIKRIYPNNYNINTLKKYKLFDTDINSSFQYCYSYYKYYLERFIEQVLNLKEIKEKIISLKIENQTSIFYQKLSSIEGHIFIRNNIFLDRLTEEEFEKLVKAINEKNQEDLQNIVKDTYKKLIVFDEQYELDRDVTYESFVKTIVKNNALVIGLMVSEIENENFNNYLKNKEQEYESILNIPVKFIKYTDSYTNNDTIYSLINLNELEEITAKETLKKYKKYLPIGSVVILKGAYKKIMITGYAPINSETKEIIYDYMACLYPEGIIKNDYNILFNHEDIKKIYAIGLQDEEQKDFIKELFK